MQRGPGRPSARVPAGRLAEPVPAGRLAALIRRRASVLAVAPRAPVDGTAGPAGGGVVLGAAARSAAVGVATNGTCGLLPALRPAAAVAGAAAGAVAAGALRAVFETSVRCFVSAAAPTATHATIATATQPLPASVAKRCCASHRNRRPPATQPGRSDQQQRADAEPRRAEASPITVARSASTA